jgi:hypothetical protein
VRKFDIILLLRFVIIEEDRMSQLLICPRRKNSSFGELEQQLSNLGLPPIEEAAENACFLLRYNTDEELYGVISVVLDTGFKANFVQPVDTQALRNTRVPTTTSHH